MTMGWKYKQAFSAVTAYPSAAEGLEGGASAFSLGCAVNVSVSGELSWRRHYPAAVLVKGMWSVLGGHHDHDKCQ
jgi:hypothetical protein